MLDSRSRQARRRGQIGRSALLLGVALALVAAACFSSLALLTACSERAETPSSEVRGAAVAAAVTAEPAYPSGNPAPSTPPPPATTPPSLPAVAPTQEPLAPRAEAPPPADGAALPAPEATQVSGLASPTVIASENTAFVDGVVDLINAARRQEGLEPLSPAASLMEAAQREARGMAEAGLLSHTGPDGSTMGERAQAAGYTGWTALGEVIGAGQTSPEAAVAQWMASPEHRARLLDPAYRELGAGYYYLSNAAYGHWWVVDLGAR
jgi:uncharacterized protein YkwD